MTTTTVAPNHLQQRMSDIRDNPHLIQFYAATRCKDCHGRGKRSLSIRNRATGLQWVDVEQICPCVKKAIQKEAKELRSDG